MSKASRLKALIQAPELLVVPGAYDPLSARLIEEAGLDAVQASGLGLSAAHLAMPDIGVLSMRETAERTAAMAQAATLPLMADGDVGYGNAVNVWYTVEAIRRAGAAGITREDQVAPRRCGHPSGKEVMGCAEMAGKAAAAARHSGLRDQRGHRRAGRGRDRRPDRSPARRRRYGFRGVADDGSGTRQPAGDADPRRDPWHVLRARPNARDRRQRTRSLSARSVRERSRADRDRRGLRSRAAFSGPRRAGSQIRARGATGGMA